MKERNGGPHLPEQGSHPTQTRFGQPLPNRVLLQHSQTQLQDRLRTNAPQTQPHPEEINVSPEQRKEKAPSIDSPLSVCTPKPPCTSEILQLPAPPSTDSSCGTCSTLVPATSPTLANHWLHKPSPRERCLLPAAPLDLEMQMSLHGGKKKKKIRLEMSNKPTLYQNETPLEVA